MINLFLTIILGCIALAAVMCVVFAVIKIVLYLKDYTDWLESKK